MKGGKSIYRRLNIVSLESHAAVEALAHCFVYHHAGCYGDVERGDVSDYGDAGQAVAQA